MNEIDKRVRNIFFIAIGVSIIALSVFLSFLYFAGKVGNLEMEKSVVSLRELEDMQSNFSFYNRAIKETIEERDILDSFIVNKKTAAKLIGDIEALAMKADVSITKTVSVEKNTTQPKENVLSFNIRARGGVGDVFYFLTLIENLPYKLRFKSLAVGMSNEDARSSLISISSGQKTTNTSIWAGEVAFEVLSYINE